MEKEGANITSIEVFYNSASCKQTKGLKKQQVDESSDQVPQKNHIPGDTRKYTMLPRNSGQT